MSATIFIGSAVTGNSCLNKYMFSKNHHKHAKNNWKTDNWNMFKFTESPVKVYLVFLTGAIFTYGCFYICLTYVCG